MSSQMSGPQRPATITVAVIALLAAVVAGIGSPLVTLVVAAQTGSGSQTSTDLTTGEVTELGPTATVAAATIELLIWVIVAAVLVLSAVLLARGAAWARIVVAIVAAVTVLGTVATTLVRTTAPSVAALVVTLLLVVAGVLAFLPPSSAYLKASVQSRPTQS